MVRFFVFCSRILAQNLCSMKAKFKTFVFKQFFFLPVLRSPGTFCLLSVLRKCCGVFRTLHCFGEIVIKLLVLFESCLISAGHFVGSGSNSHLVSS